MKLLKNICMVATATLTLSSCQGDLMDLFPYDSISSGSMWTSESLADKGVNAIYSTLFSDYVGYHMYQFDCYGVSSDCRDQDYPILTAKVTTSNGLFSGYWSQHYKGIHRANDAIAHLGSVPGMSDARKACLMAEAKTLRAYFYYKLNSVFKGVPLYLEPIELEQCIQGQETEQKVWEAVLADLTAAINEPNLPNRYESGNDNFGRVTKSLAYTLRGKTYLYLKEWEKAARDFEKVGEAGHSLFRGGLKQLFKEANEQSPEMIFSVQCIGLSGLGNDISFRYGNRNSTSQQAWNTFLVNTDFVDSFENADGSPFDWNDVIPGYNEMTPEARAVYFFRDGMTADEIKTWTGKGADMSKYLPNGNEARIKQAYANRDPRLTATIITPYSTYDGAAKTVAHTYTLRWPYRGSDTEAPFDLRTDTNTKLYYLFRKLVAEGPNETPDRSYSPVDIPLIRYADVLLNQAEAYNEMGGADNMQKAIDCVNLVRERAGVAKLNSNSATTVKDQADLRERIRNERRWEFDGEGVNFFDEMRWGTWEESKFFKGSGLKQIWGETEYAYDWYGDFLYTWPAPRSEREMNTNLTLVDGWKD